MRYQSGLLHIHLVSGKEDPPYHPYVILINFYDWECHLQNQPRKKKFRDKCNEFMEEYLYSNIPFVTHSIINHPRLAEISLYIVFLFLCGFVVAGGGGPEGLQVTNGLNK